MYVISGGEFLERFLLIVSGKQKRAVFIIYFDVSVYIFDRVAHVRFSFLFVVLIVPRKESDKTDLL